MKLWLWLLPAAATEVGWVYGLDAADSVGGWLATAACALASVFLAAGAAQRLAATTVYILFVGIGAVGVAAVDTLWIGTPLHLPRAGFLAALLVGIVGLKQLSSAGPDRRPDRGGR